MPIKAHITDPSTGNKANVIDENGQKSVIVSTRPLKIYQNKILFFTNPIYGPNMNKNAAAGGVPENIHDGTDNAYWTASDVVGGIKTTFDSADQNHTAAGAKSVLVDSSPVDDVFQFAKGGNVNCNNYTSLSMWLYIDQYWEIGDSVEIYGWDSASNTQIGNSVYLENYADINTVDSWQQLIIPLTDFGALATSTILDTFRVRIAAKAAQSPKFYLDDIQLEQTGTSITYTIQPEKGTWLRVKGFNIVMADAYNSNLADSSIPKIPYNTLLGVAALSAGIVYQRTQEGEIVNSSTIRQFIDIMQFSNARIGGAGGDGTNTWVNVLIDFSDDAILKYENEDKMTLTISDDLSGLLLFRVGASCSVEIRE